jgi:uncharacterized protein (TIGR03086 family)
MTETVANDPIALARRAYELAGRTVAGVRPEHLDSPTPCSEWTVRDLTNHMIGAHFYFTAALRGQEMAPDAPPPDFAARDPSGTFNQASSEMLRAWGEAGALDGTVKTLMGPMPAQMLIGMFTMDNLVHAWDLARATGQDESLDPELAEQMLVMIHHVNPPRGEGSPFGPEQPAPERATAVQKLAAYLGRHV